MRRLATLLLATGLALLPVAANAQMGVQLGSPFVTTGATSVGGMSVQLGSPFVTTGGGASSSGGYYYDPNSSTTQQSGTGNLSAADMVGLQQSRGAHSEMVQDAGTYGKYGSQGRGIEWIDQQLLSNRKILSEFDFFDMSGRVKALKEYVAKAVGNGYSGDIFQEQVKTIQEEVKTKVDAALEKVAEAKREAERSVGELDKAFSEIKGKLNESDRADIEGRISALKGQQDSELMSQPDSNIGAQIMVQARELESLMKSRASGPTVLSGLSGQADKAPLAVGSETAPAKPPASAAPVRGLGANGRIRRPGIESK